MCANKWLPYTGDTRPARQGVNAGIFDDKDNFAYVGRVKIGSAFRAGRLQVEDRKGLYLVSGGVGAFTDANITYLYNNASYTYRWVNAAGNANLPNAVLTEDKNVALRFPIARTLINGRTYIGNLGGVGGAVVADSEGKVHVMSNYEVLICEPKPHFKCGE